MKKERKIETSDMILGGTNRHILGSPSRNRKIGCWTMRQQANRSPLFKAGEPPVYFLMENVELIFFKEDLFLCHSARVQGRLFGSIVKCVVALFGSNSSKGFLCLQSEEKQTIEEERKCLCIFLFSSAVLHSIYQRWEDRRNMWENVSQDIGGRRPGKSPFPCPRLAHARFLPTPLKRGYVWCVI